MSTKKDMMITSSNNSEHYIKMGVYYDIKKEEERFASLSTPVRAFIRRMVLERRYELLLEIVKLSREITSLTKTNQSDISKVWYCIHQGSDQFHISPLKTNCAIEKDWEPQNKRVLLLFKIIELN